MLDSMLDAPFLNEVWIAFREPKYLLKSILANANTGFAKWIFDSFERIVPGQWTNDREREQPFRIGLRLPGEAPVGQAKSPTPGQVKIPHLTGV